MIRNKQFISKEQFTTLAKKKNLYTWEELLLYIQKLPYGRNSNRHDLSLVIVEEKGTCSSKHAFLKAIAEENKIPNIQLILGMYKMNNSNTNIGTTIIDNGLNYIPEAHCYLKINGTRVDITSNDSSFEKIEKDLLSEREINPSDISEFKVTYHINYLKKWIKQKRISMSFDEVWNIRERCIAYLSL